MDEETATIVNDYIVTTDFYIRLGKVFLHQSDRNTD